VAGKTTVYGGVRRVSDRNRRGACHTAVGGGVAGCVCLPPCRVSRLPDAWHSLQVVLYSLSVRVRGRQMHSDRTTCYAWGPSPPPHVEPDLCTAGSSWVPWWHAMLHSVALSSLPRMVCLLPSPRLFCLLPAPFVRAVDASCRAVATTAAGLVIKDASAPLHRRLGCPHPQRADLAINKRPVHQF